MLGVGVRKGLVGTSEWRGVQERGVKEALLTGGRMIPNPGMKGWLDMARSGRKRYQRLYQSRGGRRELVTLVMLVLVFAVLFLVSLHVSHGLRWARV